MSRILWMLVSVIFVCGLVVGPLTPSSTKPDQQSPAVVRQETSVDWCCVARLSCCVLPPGK